MAFFGVELPRSPKNSILVKDFNERINSSNPVFVLFQGKTSLLLNEGKEYIVFNVRINPFELPLYKYFLYLVFKKAIKKLQYKGKTKMLSNKDFQKLLGYYI